MLLQELYCVHCFSTVKTNKSNKKGLLEPELDSSSHEIGVLSFRNKS